ncbi:MAG: hypothetical protein IPM04_14790, partial [Saprospiraceae bacterium]
SKTDMAPVGQLNNLRRNLRPEPTGKEKAICFPSGTMANELAIDVLCGDKTKAFVPKTVIFIEMRQIQHNKYSETG